MIALSWEQLIQGMGNLHHLQKVLLLDNRKLQDCIAGLYVP